MQFILIASSTLLIFYGVWFFNNLIKSRRSNKIHKNYQTILDQKLLQLGFEKKQLIVGGREKITLYKRETLEITLSYEISFDTNSAHITNGRKSNTIALAATDEAKNNFIQIIDKWLVENP